MYGDLNKYLYFYNNEISFEYKNDIHYLDDNLEKCTDFKNKVDICLNIIIFTAFTERYLFNYSK